MSSIDFKEGRQKKGGLGGGRKGGEGPGLATAESRVLRALTNGRRNEKEHPGIKLSMDCCCLDLWL